ncbi:hypothetical protein QNZ42_002038 [Enterobacter cloacae]|nr:hypothetical protein [Enterobacter cloacae]
MSVNRYEFEDYGTNEPDGRYVTYEDYSELEARCAALAAENAGLKSIQAWAVADVFKSGAKRFESTKAAGFDTDDCLHDAVLVMLSELQTPATDAFLAEVRASGVEMFAAYCGEENSVFVEAKAYYRSLPDAAYEFASQLRQEAAQ